MKQSLSTLVLFGGLSLIALTGCAAQGGYYVRVPPPPARYGVVGYAPGPGYVWTDGYYANRYGRYEWVPGRWVRPPRRNSVWIRGEWQHTPRGYYFRQGHWR